MKKFRILSLLLVVVMLAGMLTGCGETVAKKDLEADPKGYIEAAMKKSFAASPFGDIIALEDTEATSVDFEIAPADDDVKSIKAAVTFANKKLAMLANLNMEVEEEKIDATVFVDEENFALKMEQLKEIFGKEAVGLGLKDFEKTFKDSAWYKMLIVESGIEEELKAEGGEDLDIGAMLEAYEKYLKELQDIAESCREFKVEDAELEIDDKKVKCYAVTETLSKDAVDKMEKAMKKFMEDVAESVGMSKEDMGIDDEEIMKEFKKPLEEVVKSSKTTYHIAKKGGALLKITSNMKMKMDDVRYNYETWEAEEFVRETSYDMVVNFGADPEKMFQPSFKVVMDDGDSKTTMSGKSEIDVEDKTFTLAMDFDAKYNDEEMAEYMDQSLDIKFVLDENGKYKMTASADGEKVEFGGKFKVDGSKLTLTMDMSEIEDAEIKEIKLTIDFDAKTPKAFEYDDLMKWNEEQINDFLAKIEELSGSAYEDPYDYDYDYEYEDETY